MLQTCSETCGYELFPRPPVAECEVPRRRADASFRCYLVLSAQPPPAAHPAPHIALRTPAFPPSSLLWPVCRRPRPLLERRPRSAVSPPLAAALPLSAAATVPVSPGASPPRRHSALAWQRVAEIEEVVIKEGASEKLNS